MRKISLTSLFLSCILFLSAQDVVVSVDVQAEQSPISPYVYGANVPTQNASAMRWGGNRTTTYNWENNYSNAGEDYHNTSDGYFTSGISSESRSIPGISVTSVVKQAHLRGQYSLVTLQAAGFVAADGNGQVSEEEAAPSERWDSIVFRKGSAFSLSPDKTDGIVYIDEYVNYLSQTLGRVGEGGVDAFGIDNEPALWRTTHPLIRPNNLTIDELFYKTVEVASIVKQHSPGSEVYGPMFYGWWDAQDFESIPNWSQYKFSRGYNWFVDFYLDSLASIEAASGQRLLDVLAVHWYPEAKGASTNKRIVNIDGSVTSEELIAPDMIEARLQAPRSLWDPTYDENGSIPGTIQYINRLKNSINTYYPGTKLAFTEFKYGAETHFSGGLALADVLGVFGREGVYMASKWDATSSYAASAYELYLNYDGNGSGFGSTSVQAEVADNSVFSIFASTDENGVLRLVVINKTDSDKSSEFSLAGGFYSKASVYGFDQTSSSVREFAAVDTIIGDSFNYSVPAYSALLFEISPLEQTQFVDASVMDANTSEIIVSFDSDITLVNASQAVSETVVIVSGDTVSVTDVLAGASAQELKFVLESPVLSTDSLITLSYAGSSITGLYDIAVASVSQKTVCNEMATAPLVVLGAEINEFGTAVFVNFSKDIDPVGLSNTSIDVNDNELSFTIDSIMVSVDDAKGLTVFVSPRLLIYDTIYIENGTHTISALDGSETGIFSYLVENNGPHESPGIDSIVVKDNFTLEVYFSKLIKSINFADAGIEIRDSESNVFDMESYAFYNNVLTLQSESPLFPDESYYFSYNSYAIQSVYGGYLDKIDDRLIDNNLPSLAPIVVIPNLIQAEDYSYHKSNSQIEVCNDEGGGEHIGFISSDNLFAYHISVPATDMYTLTVRHAAVSSSNILIRVNQDTIGTMFIPRSGSWTSWKSSAVGINLPEGDYFIEIIVENGGFNFNWLSFEQGNNPSLATIINAQTNFSGDIIIVEYDRKIKIPPLASELAFTRNGEILEISSLDFFNTDSLSLMLSLDTICYKNDEILLSYDNIQARTVNDALFEPVNEYLINNKSTQTPPTNINYVGLSFNVFPTSVNSGDEVFVHSENVSSKKLSLIDVTGKIVYENEFTAEQFSFEAPQSGIYILRILCDGKIYMKKMIIK